MIQLLGLAAICLAWLLPGHFFPWTGFQQEALAACGAILISLGVVVTAREWPVRVPALAIVSLLLAIVAILQWATGMISYLSDALLPACYLAAFALTIVSGQQLARSHRTFVPMLFGALCVGAFLSFGLGMAQWLQLGPYEFLHHIEAGDRVSANFAQPNHLATLLGLGIAGLLWCYETRRIAGVVATLGLGPLAFGLVMTGSRMAWMFIGAFVLMWLLYRRRIGLRAGAGAVALACALFAAAVLAWAPLNEALTGTRVVTLVARSQAGDRWLHWQTLWDAVWRSPWVGYGWNQMSVAQQAAVLDHPASFEWLGSSHNELLDLLVWNGVPLGLLAIGTALWWAMSRMRRCANADCWALLAALAVVFAHAMVEFPLAFTYYLLPAGLLIGAVEATVLAADTGASSRAMLGRSVYAGAAMALAGVSYLVCNEYLQVEEAVRRVRMRDAGYVQRADAPEVVLLDGPREYVHLWVTRNDDGDPGVDIDWLRTVTQRYATPPALLRYAVATAVRGNGGEAQRALQILCRIYKPKYCDQGRAYWQGLAARLPGTSQVSYPGTPPH
jgi:O-antigen ligase